VAPRSEVVRAGDDPHLHRFIDALWLEDGLSDNSLAAYRRDLAGLAGGWGARPGRRPRGKADEGDRMA